MNVACELLARLVVAVVFDVLDATVLPVVDRVVCRWAEVTGDDE